MHAAAQVPQRLSELEHDKWNGPAPTIILWHGWMGRKDSNLIAAEALACEGFRVILPDLPRHGERDPLPDYTSAQARLQLTQLPRLDHWVTVGMVSNMRDWFTRYL